MNPQEAIIQLQKIKQILIAKDRYGFLCNLLFDTGLIRPSKIIQDVMHKHDKYSCFFLGTKRADFLKLQSPDAKLASFGNRVRQHFIQTCIDILESCTMVEVDWSFLFDTAYVKTEKELETIFQNLQKE